ncbi:MAG: [FeFe] hydrogenase, group A [Patescibacteria group bacterium]|nr:[FeFe] hydrogenase, group A [Patescibacteria group bacterium]
MDQKIKVILNGKKIIAKKGQTVLEVAQKNGFVIPTLCFHPDLKKKANCRICLVEIKGRKNLATACSTEVEEGMEIKTESLRIRRARKFNLELIFAQHEEECNDCVWRFNCQLLKLAKDYRVKITRFSDRKSQRKIYQFGPVILDGTKCIDCRNCLEACPVDFLAIKNKGADIEVIPSRKNSCLYCGQCLIHCPSGAIESDTEFEKIEEPFRKKKKILIAQFAPSIRSTIGEAFGFSYGENLTNQLTAGLKKLGFDFVFDTAVGADFTTTEEVNELIERLEENKNLPLFTACCPAWVRFVEVYQPKLIPYLTTVRSPHIILGGLIKNYFAQKEKINPRKITVVSIMPCTAKKYEINRPELKIKGIPPVDHVLTTRELIYLFKKYQIDLKKIKPLQPDLPLGWPSGAGVIYGTSGGVMESALRSLYQKFTRQDLVKIDWQKIRGLKGIKMTKIKIGQKEIKVAVVNGLKNIQKILKTFKKNPKIFDYIEVMACPGGCLGGGGQPLPVNDKIREKRAEGLYQIDQKKEIKIAHLNPIVKKVYQEKTIQEIHLLTHTKYLPKKKEKIKILRN